MHLPRRDSLVYGTLGYNDFKGAVTPDWIGMEVAGWKRP
jgi:hypothetical protein